MPDIQQRIVAILSDQDVAWCDTCGTYKRIDEHIEHVAQVLVAELGLEPTYVTGWMGPTGMIRVTPPMMGEAWPEEPAKRYVRWGTTKWELAE